MNYLEIIKNVVNNGVAKQATRYDSAGNVIPVENGTIGTFCEIFRHDMSTGFPLTTLRKMPWKSIRVELEGFIKGITDKSWYENNGCKFWSEWANPVSVKNLLKKNYIDIDYGFSKKDEDRKNKIIKEAQLKETDLGRIYGYVWRNFSYDNELIQVQKLQTKYKIADSVNISDLCKNINKKKLNEFEKILYKNWYDMLNRCYNSKCAQYKWYGAIGKRVCEDWLDFNKYLSDIKNLNGWVNKQRNPKTVSLDKDYYCSDHYAPDVCVFLDSSENKLYNSSKCIEIEKNGEKYKFLNNTLAGLFIGVTRKAISHAISKNKKCKGWSIKELDGVWRYRLPTDQLKLIVDKLKTSPYDRRMVCSAWNPTILDQAALPSCHWGWNVVVYGNKLNLIWHQRSCDLLLGVGANIASYALLLELLAKESGLIPGELVGTLADCHIYENHMNAARELIKREEKTLPKIEIKNKKDNTFSIFDWTWEQAVLTGYEPHDKIDVGAVTI